MALSEEERNATELIIVGAVGFLLMIAGAHWFLKGYGLQDGHEETPYN